jgi:hypothetical protein
MLPLNSDDSVELTFGATAAGVGDALGAVAGAATAGRGAAFGFAGRGAAAFLAVFFLGADFFAAFFAVFFLAAFLFVERRAVLRRADFLATFLRVTFDLLLTRAFLDFAAFLFARFLDAFFAAIVSPLPLDRCVFERSRFPDRGN